MRIRKNNKRLGMPPAQVEALGRLSSADFTAINQNLGMPPLTVEALGSSVGVAAPKERSAKRSDAGADGAPPLLIGGESPEVANPVKSAPLMDCAELESICLDRNLKPVIVPGVRTLKGQKVGIDWVSCVFEQTAAWRYYLNSDHLVMMQSWEPVDAEEIAAFVKDIFGWVLGIYETKDSRWKEFSNGLNGYSYAVSMPLQAGIVHVGHTSKTVLVTVTGQGAVAAKLGWEERLYWFLLGVNGWLTRIDWAYDDYVGEIYPVRKMRELAKEGAFQRQGRPPKIELRGPWEQDDPDGSGLTLYIGSRMSGKFARLYEKGKQLGDEKSPWVRFEIEMHNSSYQLVLEMLVTPTKWFAGAYPCCEWIEQGGDRSSLEYKARSAMATIEGSLKWIKHQAGGHLAALREMYSDQELLDLLVRPESIPVGLQVAANVGDQCLAPSASYTEEPGFLVA
ncbi:MAG: replication initiation factor family protein [Proteobacteria bacterium]|nr:replication initiation factor family protein [Pseudomonadota bacterium]